MSLSSKEKEEIIDIFLEDISEYFERGKLYSNDDGSLEFEVKFKKKLMGQNTMGFELIRAEYDDKEGKALMKDKH